MIWIKEPILSRPRVDVSVLIAAYNAEKTIVETIRSVLIVTEIELEVVIVDDGSKDSTVLKVLEVDDPRVICVSKENGGASAARNLAFQLSTGSYIQWLDADDLLAPGKIEAQFRELEKQNPNSADIASGPWSRFFRKPGDILEHPSKLWQTLSPQEWFSLSMSHGLMMPLHCWLVPRRIAELAGAWNTKLTFDDDGEYFSRVVSKCRQVVFVPSANCFYRIGSTTNLSSTGWEKGLPSLGLSLLSKAEVVLAIDDSQVAAGLVSETFASYCAQNESVCSEICVEMKSFLQARNLQMVEKKLGARERVLRSLLGWRRLKRMRRFYFDLKMKWLRLRAKYSAVELGY